MPNEYAHQRAFEPYLLISGLLSYLTLAAFRFSIGVAIPYLETEFLLTPVLEGLAGSAYLMGMIAISLFTGPLAAKLGSDKTLMIGVSILSINSFIMSYSPSYILILAHIFFTGMGAGFLIPSIYVKMGTVMPKSRGFLVGLTNSLFTVGGFVGTFVAANLMVISSWRTPFMAYGIAGGALAMAMRYFLKSTKDGGRVTQRSSRRVSYGELLTNRKVVYITASMFSCNIAFLTFLTFGASFLIKEQGLAIESIGLILGVFSVSGGVGAMFTGIFSDRFDRNLLACIVNLIAAGSSAWLFLQASPFAVIIVLAIAFGFGGIPYWNLLVSAVQDLAGEQGTVETATAMTQNIGWIGAMLGPIIAGTMLLYIDFRLTLLITVSIAFLVGAVLPLVARRGYYSTASESS